MTQFSPDFNRLLKVLRREGEPDRVPFYEHFVDDEVIQAMTGIPVTKMMSSDPPNVKAYLGTLVEFYSKLGYDYVPLEIPIRLPRQNQLRTMDVAYLSRGMRVWENESRGAIERIEDFERYPWPDPEEAVDLTWFEMLAKLLPEGMGVVGGVAGGVFEHVNWLMGLANLCRAIHLDKELTSRMFQTIGSLIYSIDRVIVAGGYVGALRMGEDLGFKTGTFIPSRSLREYAFPWYRRLSELAHGKGMPFLIHSCGNIYMPDGSGKSVMDYLVEDVHIDAKHSYEDIIVPASEIKRRYAGRLAVLGGVDVDKLARSPERELRAYVRTVIRGCAPGGGYALGSGNTVTNYVPIENYLAMLDEGRRNGLYPIT